MDLPRFSLLALGSAAFEHGGVRYDVEVRLVRSERPGPAFHALASGRLGEARRSLELARADAPPGTVWRLDLSLGKDDQPCPICKAPTYASARYARHLCAACELEAVDVGGRSLRFSNAGIGGGFRAQLADGSEVPDGHECFVRGVRCRADEGRFGGIVVQPVT